MADRDFDAFSKAIVRLMPFSDDAERLPLIVQRLQMRPDRYLAYVGEPQCVFSDVLGAVDLRVTAILPPDIFVGRDYRDQPGERNRSMAPKYASGASSQG